jgi:GxxExxY protein
LREINSITEKIIGCAIAVHRALGPGLWGSPYEACLAYDLVESGLFVERQKGLPIVYRGVELWIAGIGILHVRPKVVYTFCDFEKTLFFYLQHLPSESAC